VGALPLGLVAGCRLPARLNPIQASCPQKTAENPTVLTFTPFHGLQGLQQFGKVSRASAANLLQDYEDQLLIEALTEVTPGRLPSIHRPTG
jgi:hypothetical protein